MSIRRYPGFLLWLMLALPLTGAVQADDVLGERLRQLTEQGKPRIGDARLADVRVLEEFYQDRDYGFAWTGPARVEALERLAQGSRGDGLRASDFHLQEIHDLLKGRDPASLSGQLRADADILLSDSLLRLIHHYRYGKVDPQALDPTWNHAEGPYSTDLVRDLERAAEASDLAAEVRGLMPGAAFYSRLKKGLAHYREIAAAGGWKPVSPGRTLKPGMRDSRVPEFRERLRVTGDYSGPEVRDPRLFDAALKRGVMAFQKRHTLAVDGVVGPATLAAMNVSVENRIDQIRVNLERMRWVYDQLPDDYLLVDVAGQVWQSRVIVGRQDRPTPVFRDQVEYLEVNPTWTVPPTILKDDILPNARKNPGYVSKKGLEVVTRGGKKVSPSAVNWNVSAGSFPYMLRQPAGERNALGRVKFMFPNRFSVYLHDTPSRNLFNKPQRLFSSGCVRVENPMELAELMLDGRWSQDKLKSMVQSKRTRWLHLKEPLPIILAYWTADTDEDGRVRFREDVYQRDAQVLAALNGEGPLRLAYVQEPSAEPAAHGEPDDVADGPSDDEAASEASSEPRTTANGPSGRARSLGL
jgi:murein L,D-transpeptidase YcbB/YkuD